MPQLEQIHLMVLHFPIVLTFLLLLADAIALWQGASLSGRGSHAVVSLIVAALTGLSAAVTAVFGDMAYDVAIEKGVAEAVIELHEGMGSTTAIILVVWAVLRVLVWWRGIDLSGRRVLGVVAVDVVLCVLIVITAYLGGQLVYEHGVNVIPNAG